MKLQTSPKLAELTRDQDMVLLHEGCTLTAGEFLELTPAGNAWKVEGLEMFADFKIETEITDGMDRKGFNVDVEAGFYFGFELENGKAKVSASYKDVVEYTAEYENEKTASEADYYGLCEAGDYFSKSEIEDMLEDENFNDQLETLPRVKQVMEILEACQLVDDTTRLAA